MFPPQHANERSPETTVPAPLLPLSLGSTDATSRAPTTEERCPQIGSSKDRTREGYGGLPGAHAARPHPANLPWSDVPDADGTGRRSVGGMAELLTVDDVAHFLRISRTGVYRLVDRRDIRFYKVGGVLRFAPADVRAYLQERQVPG